MAQDIRVVPCIKYTPDFILVDRLVEHLPVTHKILQGFQGADFTTIDDIRAIKKPQDFGAAKKVILITRHRGGAFKPCQGMGPGHLCCNYYVLDLISNCPLDCSYCILQSYLANNPILTIYANIDEILDQAEVYLKKQREKRFRIGSGELSDSLALDHITGFSAKMIGRLSPLENVTLELKTKTANIDHLLTVEGSRAVISWSVNPQGIIDTEEAGAASLEERLSAAMLVIDHGYNIGFHFDPIIHSEDWEGGYRDLALQIVERFPPGRIAWISLGTLRFPQQMKEIATKRFPRSKIFYGELVPTGDKVRYFRPIRQDIYKKMLSWLHPLKEKTHIYLCMETRPVWKNVAHVNSITF